MSGVTKYRYTEHTRKMIMSFIRKRAYLFVDVKESSFEQDTKQATDFIIVVSGGTIAFRIRDYVPYFDRHERDFTLRSRVPFGGRTEIHKIKDGFGDWYVYIWKDKKNVWEYYIIADIDKLRESGLLDIVRPDIPNGDGTFFRAYSIEELKNVECVVESNL